jgi:hypothetical protein
MRAPHGPLSRRQLFATLIGAGGAAILLAANEATAAPAKTDQRTVKYQDYPKNGLSCTQCKAFKPPNTCQRVAGSVSPNGWCNLFAKKV